MTFIRGTIVSLILALAIATIWSVATGQTRFVADINGLFPSSGVSNIELKAHEKLQVQNGRQITVFAGHKNKKKLEGLLPDLKSRLKQINTLTLQEVSEEEQTKLNKFHEQNLGIFASEDDFQKLRSGQGKALINRTLQSLFLPGSLLTSAQLKKDPLGLYNSWISSFTSKNRTSFLGNDGMYYIRISVFLEEHLNQEEKEATLIGIKQKLDDFSDDNAGFATLSTGAPFYESQIAEKSKTEALFLSIGATLGVIILLLVVFRSSKVIAGALFIVSGGVLSGAAATFLIFDTVHLIAVAFGSSLIGVVVDYAIHFYAARRSDEPMSKTAVRIRLGLLLGAGTSIIGFVALLFSNMMFLQQVAVYSTFGVIGAAITVLVFLPTITVFKPIKGFEVVDNKWGFLHSKLTPNALTPILTVASVLLASAILFEVIPSSDSVRNLRVSTPEITRPETQLSKLGPNIQSRILLIVGNSSEEILQREEMVKSELILSGANRSSHVLSLSDFLPSVKRQQEITDYTLKALASDPAAPLLALIGPFEPSNNIISLNIEVVKNFPADIRNLRIDGKGAGQHGHLMILSGKTETPAINQLLSNSPWIKELDITQKYTSDMSQMRTKATQALIAGIIFANLIFVIRYGLRKGLQTLIAPSAATLFALGSVSFLTDGLSFFSIIAGFLVFALGADYALFQMASSEDDSNRAYRAVTLSAISTVLVFGLMSFSSIPVLNLIGSTIVLGVAFAWWFSPLAISRKKA